MLLEKKIGKSILGKVRNCAMCFINLFLKQRVYSHLSCMVQLKQTPFGADLLGRCEYSNPHSGAHQTTELRPSCRDGLGSVPNELWYGPFNMNMNRPRSDPTAESMLRNDQLAHIVLLFAFQSL